MTIQEALKSGKQFKRKHYKFWHDCSLCQDKFTKEEVLADDWEVKPEPIKVEFDCNFIKIGHKDFRPATLSGFLDLPDEVQGKRFHVVATEIVE